MSEIVSRIRKINNPLREGGGGGGGLISVEQGEIVKRAKIATKGEG